jgi:hypothetical protein
VVANNGNLFVLSVEGLWNGERWVRRWAEALSYPDGRSCLEAAADLSERTGLRCVMAYAERKSTGGSVSLAPWKTTNSRIRPEVSAISA